MIFFFDCPARSSEGLWVFYISGISVGIIDQNNWCMKLGEEIILLDRESRFVPVVPVLEISAEEFSKSLEGAARCFPSEREKIINFPIELLLKHVFHTSFSSYWPEKAIVWLEKYSEILPKFRDELVGFCENKAMSQFARQHARRLLRRFH